MKGRLALLLVAVALGGLAGNAHADPAGDVLENPKYRFCHEGDYPMWNDERDWCDLVNKPSARCPKFHDACAAKRTPKLSRTPFTPPKKRRKRTTPGEDDDREAGPKTPDWDFDFSLPKGLSSVAQVVMWLLLALGIGALAYMIYKNLAGHDDLDDVDDDELEPILIDEKPKRDRRVETDVERLLARARAAAERGDFERAIEDTYAALLRRLDGDGMIDMHASRTNGDYVRGLRAWPDLRRAVRLIVRDVERVQFGALTADRALFEKLLAKVMPLVHRTSQWLVVIALGSLALTLTACVPGGGGGGGTVSRDPTSPSGSTAFVEVLRASGATVGYRKKPLDEMSDSDDGVDVMIVLPDGGPEEGDWDPILNWVRRGGTLVVAGEPGPEVELRLRSVVSSSDEPELRQVPLGFRKGPELDLVAPPRRELEHIGGELMSFPVLTREGRVYAAQRRMGDGEVIVFADHLLFTNVAMAARDNAEFQKQIIGGQRRIEVADRWSSAGSSSPLEAIHQARLTPLMLQLLAMMALYLLYKGIAFGTLRDPASDHRRSFSDHARALGLQYARARASNHALGMYANWAIERMRERAPKEARRSLSSLAAWIAERVGRQPNDVLRILVEARSASDVTAPPSMRPSSQRGEALAASDDRGSETHDLTLMRELANLLSLGAHDSRARRQDGRSTPKS